MCASSCAAPAENDPDGLSRHQSSQARHVSGSARAQVEVPLQMAGVEPVGRVLGQLRVILVDEDQVDRVCRELSDAVAVERGS